MEKLEPLLNQLQETLTAYNSGGDRIAVEKVVKELEALLTEIRSEVSK